MCSFFVVSPILDFDVLTFASDSERVALSGNGKAQLLKCCRGAQQA